MIEIFRREEGKDRLIRAFETLEDLFRVVWHEDDLKVFGFNPSQRTTRRYAFNEVDRTYGYPLGNYYELGYNRHVYVAYDNDILIPPDVLVGKLRAYRRRPTKDWRWRYNARNDRGARKDAYGSHRRIRTLQETKWADAWDNEEFAPSDGFCRKRRNRRNLPNSWDDVWARNQKSWKKQSKRRHQWRPNRIEP